MKTLCVLPFIHLNLHASGQASVCCVSSDPLLDNDGRPLNVKTHTLEAIWRSEALQTVREQMLSGQRPKQCNTCYTMEDRGHESRRYIENDMFLAGFNTPSTSDTVSAHCKSREWSEELQVNSNDLTKEIGKPWHFDLRFDNVCNLKCVICGGHSSSRIEGDRIHMAWTGEKAIERKANRFSNAAKWVESDDLFEELRDIGSNVKYLQLAGGEPFMSKLALRWLAYLRETGRSRDVTLRIFTNLNTFNEEIVDTLACFRRVHVILSIDATGATYEYVRFPGKWSVVDRHSALLAEERQKRLKNVQVTINATMSAHSAMRITEVYDFAKRREFSVMLNNATYPAYASTRFLPNRTKLRLEQNLREYAAKNPEFSMLPQQTQQWMDVMREVDIMAAEHKSAVIALMQFTNDMDASRGLSFPTLQPDVYEDYCAEFGRWVAEGRFTGQPSFPVDANK